MSEAGIIQLAGIIVVGIVGAIGLLLIFKIGGGKND